MMSKSQVSRLIAFAAVAAFVLTPASKAQEMTNVYMLDGGAFTNALMANSLAERVERAVGTVKERQTPSSTARSKPAQTSTKPGSLSFRASAGFDTPREMAAGYPADKRAEAEALFRKLLIMFADVEKQFGQPKRDLPTALALFIVTSHEAATGQKMPKSYGIPLVQQLRNALAADPAMVSASDGNKQRLYEQLAIIGMMTGGTMLALKETPNRDIAAKLKTAGNGYFRQVLKLDPARIDFTNQGMRLSRG
jgi:hypothetical protein